MSQVEEISIYGTTIAKVLEDFGRAKATGYTKNLYITSIISDVQEAIECNQRNRARALCNKAKYLLNNIP